MFTPEQFRTFSLQSRPAVMRVLASAMNSVDAGAAVRNHLRENPLPSAKRVFAFGLGKAACAMTSALADSTELVESLVVTKHASPALRLRSGRTTVIEGNHPVPGVGSVNGGNAALNFASQLTPDDLLVCLISGGGSALMTAPRISLEDLQSLTSALLACGARIDEINTLRRHLDQLKGGGLARAATSRGAQIISLILSDVVNDSIEAIASGPTAPDPTTSADALSIIEKYDLKNKIPAAVIPSLHETPKPDEPIFERVQNTIIASNSIALRAAQSQAKAEGFETKILRADLQGEASLVGREMAMQLRESLQTNATPVLSVGGR